MKETIKIVPSGREDYCCECGGTHGYDCPKEKREEHKHQWVFVGNYTYENGLGQRSGRHKKFICPDCEKVKYIQD